MYFEVSELGFEVLLGFLEAWLPNCEPQRAAREVGLKSAPGAVLGFGVSKQKPREVILNPGGGGNLRTAKPKLSGRFR